ncbi:hypothetical protein, partial [Kribbella sp. NPDC006257]|uniref:hypothetical protein n=1 Tax=Kribbella sp. NPDC006257 TaxID=3156738 RepID=UPI0033A0A7C9
MADGGAVAAEVAGTRVAVLGVSCAGVVGGGVVVGVSRCAGVVGGGVAVLECAGVASAVAG